MTALRNVWVTTEDGDVVRADGIAGFHLKALGSDGSEDPVDVEVWITIEHFGPPILLVSEGADRTPALLAELISVLADSEKARDPVLFVRPRPPRLAEGESRSHWVIEPTAPIGRWEDFVLG